MKEFIYEDFVNGFQGNEFIIVFLKQSDVSLQESNPCSELL